VLRLRSVSLAATTALALLVSGCGGGGGGSSPVPQPTSTTPPVNAAFTCPSSATTFAAARGGTSATVRRPFVVHRPSAIVPNEGALAITYDTSRLQNAQTLLDNRVAQFGGKTITELSFPRIQRAIRVVSVAPSQQAQAQAGLRAQPGVINVQPIQRRYADTVNGPYFTKNPDPYFYSTAPAPTPGPPLYEAANYRGQWDMHIIGLESAFAYSRPTLVPGSVTANPNALGSPNVRLAIIDTGEDVTQPVIANAHVVRTECFITNASGTVQSTGAFVTDPTGHGTDVTGIAAGAPSQGFGFEGAAGNVSLMLYRVFPTPDDNCVISTNNDPQCGAADVDIASAIDDAVANGANVINMSFGGSTCVTPSASNPGGDQSAAEGTAVESAIQAGVIVVAASGNGGTSGVAAPGCDQGVIAVGASAYWDGVANGTGFTGPGPEYVAYYSQWGSPNTPDSTSSWGLVAPGGDASSNTDTDDLHWIENIWTSTPYQSSPSDTNYVGDCSTDFFGESGNCRTLVDGTSMAAPHVAGAAALILSVANPTYSTATEVKNLLCTTATNINDPHQGCGRLDVYRAMAYAMNDPTKP
jgi:subtilisin family serine protease